MSVGAFLGPERQAASGLVRRAETRIGAFEDPDETRIGTSTHVNPYTQRGCAPSRMENAEGSSYKTVGGVTTTYLYDGLALVSETVGGGGGNTSYFVHGAGIDEPLAMSRAGVVSYFAVDALGSAVATSDAAGTVTHAVAFDAWGVEKASSGTRMHPFTYTGREVGEAGSLFYRARYYSPGVGRFSAEDPSRLRGGPHFYVYVKSNPVAGIDPLGLETIVVITRGSDDDIIGTHAAVWISNDDGSALYDPAGSYAQENHAGSGDLLTSSGNKEATNLMAFVQHHSREGDTVELYRFDTTIDEEREILRRVEEYGGGTPLACTLAVSAVLDGIGPFKGLGTFKTPAGLGRELSRRKRPKFPWILIGRGPYPQVSPQ